MKTTCAQNLLTAELIGVLAFTVTIARAAVALPSWNDGRAGQSIIEFVAKVTKPGSRDFVPVAERIATFDNDDPPVPAPCAPGELRIVTAVRLLHIAPALLYTRT